MYGAKRSSTLFTWRGELLHCHVLALLRLCQVATYMHMSFNIQHNVVANIWRHGKNTVCINCALFFSSRFDYIHKKQSGGSGQYGRVIGKVEVRFFST